MPAAAPGRAADGGGCGAPAREGRRGPGSREGDAAAAQSKLLMLWLRPPRLRRGVLRGGWAGGRAGGAAAGAVSRGCCIRVLAGGVGACACAGAATQPPSPASLLMRLATACAPPSVQRAAGRRSTEGEAGAWGMWLQLARSGEAPGSVARRAGLPSRPGVRSEARTSTCGKRG